MLESHKFIDVAERSGLSTQVTSAVLHEVAPRVAGWRRLAPELRVTVNVSKLTLHQRPFAKLFGNLAADVGCEPQWFGVELNEGALVGESGRARDALDGLRALGIRIDIDDFGSGYSAIGRLAELPVNGLKIDQRFVRAMTDRRQEAIVRAMIALGHGFGFEVIAEGVEDRTTWELLAALGCDAAQGHHIARPLAPENVAVWLQDWDAGLAFIQRSKIGEGLIAEPAPSGSPGAHGVVLVVDDEPPILALVSEILISEGFQVLTAANGADALRLIERSTPDMVLLDLNMPTLDGEGFTSAVRARGLGVAIVIMTAGPSAKRWAERLRADAYLSKPFKLSSLLDLAGRYAN